MVELERAEVHECGLVVELVLIVYYLLGKHDGAIDLYFK